MPVIVVPSIQRRRPTETMSVHVGMNGAACLVDAQSVSSSSQVGSTARKVVDQRVYQRARVVMIASARATIPREGIAPAAMTLAAYTQRKPQD